MSRHTLRERPNQKPPLPQPSGWKVALYFLGGGIALFGVAFLILNQVYTDPSLSGEAKLSLVFVLLFFVLGFSVGGLGYVIRVSLQRTHTNPVLAALVLAYGLPLIIYLFFAALLSNQTGQVPGALQKFALLSSLFSGQPWFFIWQAIILAFFGRPFSRPTVEGESVWKSPYLPASLLSGVFIGLVAAFSFSLGSGFLQNSSSGQLFSQSIEMPLTVRLITLGVALAIAPWAEEQFFRGEVLARWQPHLGKVWAFVAVAGLYAFLQFRPLLWLPAFLASLGFSLLAERTGQVRNAAIAHAVVNVVLFLLGWYLVL